MMAGGCVILGEMWSWLAETYRIGNDHMSYRAYQLWWGRHRFELFLRERSGWLLGLQHTVPLEQGVTRQPITYISCGR
jgi:hypothetical protein